VHATLPLDLAVTDRAGNVRDDLSGVRVTEQGVYVFAMPWPTAAKAGTWKVSATDRISGKTDTATFEARERDTLAVSSAQSLEGRRKIEE